MSVSQINSSNFFPSSDAVGYILYPPVSPDFPQLKSKNSTPGSDPEPPTLIPTWINPPAPGLSPDLEEQVPELSAPIPIPRATPFPADHVKFDTTKRINQTVSTEDELPKFSPKEKTTHAFTGYD